MTPTRFADPQLQLTNQATGAIPPSRCGKVVEGLSDGTFTLRFTAVPPPARKLLTTLTLGLTSV